MGVPPVRQVSARLGPSSPLKAKRLGRDRFDQRSPWAPVVRKRCDHRRHLWARQWPRPRQDRHHRVRTGLLLVIAISAAPASSTSAQRASECPIVTALERPVRWLPMDIGDVWLAPKPDSYVGVFLSGVKRRSGVGTREGRGRASVKTRVRVAVKGQIRAGL
jgi:hypothetical protein